MQKVQRGLPCKLQTYKMPQLLYEHIRHVFILLSHFFALVIKCNGPANDHVMRGRGQIVFIAFHRTHTLKRV